jgi:hypothetical protein
MLTPPAGLGSGPKKTLAALSKVWVSMKESPCTPSEQLNVFQEVFLVSAMSVVTVTYMVLCFVLAAVIVRWVGPYLCPLSYVC